MFLTAEYLLGRVVVLPKGCWEWTGAKSKDGYGILRVEGKQVVARRIFWLMFRSEIQEGQVLRQRLKPPRCIGHLCCNPDHLEIRDVHGPIWEMCPNQHRLVPRNTIIEKRPGGGITKRCKICRAAYWREKKSRQRSNRIGVQGYSRKDA